MSDLADRARATGLLGPGRPVVVLLSGGRDSVCLLDVAVTIAGPAAVSALHVNYGLRPAAAADEAHCRALCERLGVALHVHAATAPAAGNLQAWARDQRYAVAAGIALGRGADVAAGHTATDQVETVLYRLAASPGRRALLGMRPREGRLIRPLLAVARAETAAHCEARGLTWRDDASNADPSFARNRARAGLVPALRELHAAAEANVLRTLEVLREEAAVLDELVDGVLGRDRSLAADRLATLAPALRRLVLQRLADRAAGGTAPAVGARVGEVLALAAAGGTHHLDLGGGLRATIVYGELLVERGAAGAARPAPAAAAIAVPVGGRVAWAGGELTCERGPDLPVCDGTLDAAAVGAAALEVRAWRPGDRMRPLGLAGSRSLQDLFTDRKVRREDRPQIPVVLAGGEIAWVPGVATGERFRVTPATGDRLRLAWHAG